MAYIFRRPYLDPRRVPTIPVRLREEWVARCAPRGVWLPGVSGGRDYSAFGNNGTLVGSPAIGGTAHGPAMLFSGTQEVDASPVSIPGVNAWFTFIIQPANVTQNAGIINQRVSSTSSNSFSMGFNYDIPSPNFSVEIGNGAGNTLAYRFSAAAISTTRPTVCDAVVIGNGPANGRIQFYCNGVSQSLASTPPADTAITGFFVSSEPLRLGRVNSTGNFYYSGSLALAVIRSRLPAPGEIAAGAAAPFGMFEPQSTRTFVDLATAYGVLSGSSAAIVTTSGALSGAGILVGASSVAPGASGALSGSGVLSGASLAIGASSGALVGDGRVAGTSAAAVTASGILAGLGALSGASATRASASGALLGVRGVLFLPDPTRMGRIWAPSRVARVQLASRLRKPAG